MNFPDPALQVRSMMVSEMLMQLSYVPSPGVPSPNTFAWNRLRRKTAETLLWLWKYEPFRAPVGPDDPLPSSVPDEMRPGLLRMLREIQQELKTEIVEAAGKAANEVES